MVKRVNSQTKSELYEFGPGNAGKNDSCICGRQKDLDENYGDYDADISYVLEYAEDIPGFASVKVTENELQVGLRQDNKLFKINKKNKNKKYIY